MTHYNAAKAGLAAASENLRVEIEGSGVHVLTVYPEPVYSEMEAAAREQFVDSAAVANVPTGTPEELAQLVYKTSQKRSDRLIYPRVYTLGRSARNVSQWLTNKLTPALK